MNTIMTRDDILTVMAAHPTLSAFGFGKYNYESEEERTRRDLDSRESLMASGPMCSRVCEWLESVEKIGTINRRHSSYGLKHWVERRDCKYVSNGAFICAAIHMGFRFEADGPNAQFNMSERSLSQLEAV